MEAEDVPISTLYLSSSTVVRRDLYSIQRVLARLLVDWDSYPGDAGHGALFFTMSRWLLFGGFGSAVILGCELLWRTALVRRVQVAP